MYKAQILLRQIKSCILTRFAQDFESPLNVHFEELHDRKVTFVIDAGEHPEKFYARFNAGEHVVYIKRLVDRNLGVTKSSGAYTAVSENHGVLRRQNYISATECVYNVLFSTKTI